MPEQRPPRDDDSLFVRVEGYRVVLQQLEAVSQIVANMQEAIQVLEAVNDVKEETINTFLENADKLETELASVEDEMPQVRGVERNTVDLSDAAPQEDEEIIDNSMDELHSELKGLKDQLSEL